MNLSLVEAAIFILALFGLVTLFLIVLSQFYIIIWGSIKRGPPPTGPQILITFVLLVLFLIALFVMARPFTLLASDDDPVRRWWQEYDLRQNLENQPPSPPLPPSQLLRRHDHPCERYGRIAYSVSLGLGPYSSDDPIITYIIRKAPHTTSNAAAGSYAGEIREVCYQNSREDRP